MVHLFRAESLLAVCLVLIGSVSTVRADSFQPGLEIERRLIEQAEQGSGGNVAADDDGQSEEPPGLLGYRLHGRGGLSVEYVYTGEVFSNMRGGLNTTDATEYRGNFDLVITANLDEMGFAPGGALFLYGQNGHGQGITDRHVGDYQVLSNIDARDFMQMSEYWWERSLWDGLVRVRLGKRDCNEDFAAVDLAAHFINSSFGLHPTIPMPTFPDPSMAATVFFKVTDWLWFDAGVWDGVPDGRNWGFSGTGVTFSVYEFRAAYDLWDSLHGECHAAIWYHSGRWDDLAPGSTATFTGNRGIHAAAEQMIFKELPSEEEEADEDDGQGLGVFGQYSWAPEDRNEAHQYIGARLSPWTMVQPDLQYIASPNGNGRDAFAFGLRFELIL